MYAYTYKEQRACKKFPPPPSGLQVYRMAGSFPFTVVRLVNQASHLPEGPAATAAQLALRA